MYQLFALAAGGLNTGLPRALAISWAAVALGAAVALCLCSRAGRHAARGLALLAYLGGYTYAASMAGANLAARVPLCADETFRRFEMQIIATPVALAQTPASERRGWRFPAHNLR